MLLPYTLKKYVYHITNMGYTFHSALAHRSKIDAYMSYMPPTTVSTSHVITVHVPVTYKSIKVQI